MKKTLCVSRSNKGLSLGKVLDCLPSTITASIQDVTYTPEGWHADVEFEYDPNVVSFHYWETMVL